MDNSSSSKIEEISAKSAIRNVLYTLNTKKLILKISFSGQEFCPRMAKGGGIITVSTVLNFLLEDFDSLCNQFHKIIKTKTENKFNMETAQLNSKRRQRWSVHQLDHHSPWGILWLTSLPEPKMWMSQTSFEFFCDNIIWDKIT